MTEHTALHVPPAVLPARSLWERTYPGTAEQLSAVRAAVRGHLHGCPVTDDVVLLVSELATNAVLHSSSGQPHGTFTVRVHDFPGDCVYAEIEDSGSSWHGDLERSAEPPHGLRILQMLAAACGTDTRTRSHVVWFTISYPHGASAPGPVVPDADPFKLRALRAACPEFAFRSIDVAGKRSIEAVRVTGTGNLYAVITSDPAELWRTVRFSREHTDESS